MDGTDVRGYIFTVCQFDPFDGYHMILMFDPLTM